MRLGCGVGKAEVGLGMWVTARIVVNFLILKKDQIQYSMHSVVNAEATIAIVPLVSGKESTVKSIWPAYMDSAKDWNTVLSFLANFAIFFKLKWCFWSAAKYWENEWLKILNLGIFRSRYCWNDVSPKIVEWNFGSKNSWIRARLTGCSTVMELEMFWHWPILGGRYKSPEVTEHKHGKCITQNGQPLIILWPVEQSRASIEV